MTDDWSKIKSPDKFIVMKNHVKFCHNFFVCTFVMYNFTILIFPFVALQTYFTDSVENRYLPLLVKYPFSTVNSPIFEIIYINQTIFLAWMANIYCVSDSSYVAMVINHFK